MLRVLKKVRLLFAAVSFAVQLLGAPQSRERGFCAIELDVSLSDGSPVATAEADLVDFRENVVKTVSIRSGKGLLCDFGFGYYSIRVRRESLLPTTISGVKLIYGETQHLRFVLNQAGRQGDEFRVGRSCGAYVRVVTSKNEPVSLVRVTSDRSVVEETDEFGRLLLRVRLRDVTLFHFEKPGFRSADLTMSCDTLYDDIERSVILTPKD